MERTESQSLNDLELLDGFVSGILEFKRDYPDRAIKMVKEALDSDDLEGMLAVFSGCSAINLTLEQLLQARKILKRLIFEIPNPPLEVVQGKFLQERLTKFLDQSFGDSPTVLEEINTLLKQKSIVLDFSGVEICLTGEAEIYFCENLRIIATLIQDNWVENFASQVNGNTEQVLKRA